MSNQNSNNTLLIAGIVGGILLLGFLFVVVMFVGAGIFLYQSAARPSPSLAPATTVTSDSPETVEGFFERLDGPDDLIAAPEPFSKLPTLPQPDDSPVIAPVPTSAVEPEDSATPEPPQNPTSGT